MKKINESINKIIEENEFMRASQIVKEYRKNNPNKKLLSLGIGDVSRPIVKTVIEAMHHAVDDLSNMETFHGYGDSSGYDFLKTAILENDYKDFNFTNDEIYVSNGTKTDSTSILELFDINSKIGIFNPMYPIYKNGAYCLNRNIKFFSAYEEDGFIPKIPDEKLDIIYLCSPSNPVGNAFTYDELKKWVNYALNNDAIVMYDNAYFAFIQSENVPKSIYEIDGAEKVAIEMRSFSKSISFTGVRCSYYIIPNQIYPGINQIWKKRTINRFNGADYIAQRGAEASYLPEAKKEIQDNINIYHKNTKLLKDFFEKEDYKVFGGIDSPFIWVKIKDNKSSWEKFNIYLNELNVIITPGSIFGKDGDGYMRISGLAKEDTIIEAIERIKKYEEK